jgi:hypothetical protein
MLRSIFLALAVGLLAAAARAAEMVGVEGSSTQYPVALDSQVAGKPVAMVLTGVALRQRAVFNVYTIGSYVQQGTSVHNAEELAAADVPKQLHLVMERNVDGKDLATAFRTAVRRNYPAPAFEEEIATLAGYLEGTSVKKGDHVWLTYAPGVGFQGSAAGKTPVVIKNPSFGRAIWEMYLGKHPVQEGVKQGLVGRL